MTCRSCSRWMPSSVARAATYSKQVHAELRSAGWRGYWIDAASTLRMAEDSVIILDPVNRQVIDAALTQQASAITSVATAP